MKVAGKQAGGKWDSQNRGDEVDEKGGSGQKEGAEGRLNIH